MWRLLAFLLLMSAPPVLAQTAVVSDGPESVSLTVYRGEAQNNRYNRGRNAVRPINKNWPTGYALITETRTVTIPAGESVIRFEGVAEGMFPESAIVTGLPSGVREKNRDARLLSPTGLVDAYLKRQVSITRTSAATGKVTTSEAIITAGPFGGVILQTAEGYEALRCTGLPERISYGRKPEDLSARPTLSVMTSSDRPVTAKLTLTYMASGFDWQANYIANVKTRGADGKGKVDLFAWLTLANGGNQSFVNANTMAIAGKPNRVRRAAQARPTGGALRLKCWPMQRTHQVPRRHPFDVPPPPPAPMMMMESAADSIVVTGSRRDKSAQQSMPVAVVVAEQEDLGDLKLYRVPEPVTVNAKGQKQVAMLVQPGADFTHYYSASLDQYEMDEGESNPMWLFLRGENKKEKGLGLPMPQGQILVYENSSYGPLLAGETQLKDRAIGEEVIIGIGNSPDVRYSVTKISERNRKQRWKVEVTNARNSPVNIELSIPFKLSGNPKNIRKVDGVPTWKVTVPANGEAKLYYTLKLEKEG